MSIYEEIEFEDLEFDDEEQHFTYPCPCGDKFIITLVRIFRSTATCGWVSTGHDIVFHHRKKSCSPEVLFGFTGRAVGWRGCGSLSKLHFAHPDHL
jgi:diphthamide biosynthesis protein 3